MANNINSRLNIITDYLSFGIKTIDLHNEKFYKLLEELRIYSISKDKKSVIKEILNEFEAYSKYHFHIEEKLMKDSNYPDFETHVQQHQFFIKKIHDFKQSFEYRNTIVDEQILNFMRKWFVVHISDIDKEFATYYHLFQQKNSQSKSNLDEKQNT
jgi:hemerythrin